MSEPGIQSLYCYLFLQAECESGVGITPSCPGSPTQTFCQKYSFNKEFRQRIQISFFICSCAQTNHKNVSYPRDHITLSPFSAESETGVGFALLPYGIPFLFSKCRFSRKSYDIVFPIKIFFNNEVQEHSRLLNAALVLLSYLFHLDSISNYGS